MGRPGDLPLPAQRRRNSSSERGAGARSLHRAQSYNGRALILGPASAGAGTGHALLPDRHNPAREAPAREERRMDQTDQHEAGLDLSGLGPYLAGIDFPIGKAALLDILDRKS